MSDLSALHSKIDFLVGHVATLATRDELTEVRGAIVATRDELGAAIVATGDEMRAATLATRDELTEMRVEIMARIDRLQDASTIQHHERIVDVASSERAERIAKAAREDVTSLGEIVTPLIRVVHFLRSQIDDLAEQVRVLKEGRAG